MRPLLIGLLFFASLALCQWAFGPSVLFIVIATVLAVGGIMWTGRGKPLVFRGKVIGETRGMERVPAKPWPTSFGPADPSQVLRADDLYDLFKAGDENRMWRVTGRDGDGTPILEPMFSAVRLRGIDGEERTYVGPPPCGPFNDNGEPEMGGAA